MGQLCLLNEGESHLHEAPGVCVYGYICLQLQTVCVTQATLQVSVEDSSQCCLLLRREERESLPLQAHTSTFGRVQFACSTGALAHSRYLLAILKVR